MNRFGAPALRVRSPRFFAVLLALAPLVACGSGSSKGGGGSTTANATAFFVNTNNYTSTSKLTIPQIPVTAGADLDICWDMVTEDLQCHPVTPATDIISVTFLQLQNLTEDQVATMLAQGQDPPGADVESVNQFFTSPSSTCTSLSTFAANKQPIDLTRDFSLGEVYAVIFASNETLGLGTRSLVFLEPSASETNTMVAGPPGCNTLDFQFTFASSPVTIPAGGPWIVDWKGLTKDSLGQAILAGNIDGLEVGFYQGKMPSDLEQNPFGIQTTATSFYQTSFDSSSTRVNLSAAKDMSGAAFSGFGMAAGTWVLGLTCSTCPSPAPVALAVLQPQ